MENLGDVTNFKGMVMPLSFPEPLPFDITYKLKKNTNSLFMTSEGVGGGREEHVIICDWLTIAQQ